MHNNIHLYSCCAKNIAWAPYQLLATCMHTLLFLQFNYSISATVTTLSVIVAYIIPYSTIMIFAESCHN